MVGKCLQSVGPGANVSQVFFSSIRHRLAAERGLANIFHNLLVGFWIKKKSVRTISLPYKHCRWKVKTRSILLSVPYSPFRIFHLSLCDSCSCDLLNSWCTLMSNTFEARHNKMMHLSAFWCTVLLISQERSYKMWACDKKVIKSWMKRLTKKKNLFLEAHENRLAVPDSEWKGFTFLYGCVNPKTVSLVQLYGRVLPSPTSLAKLMGARPIPRWPLVYHITCSWISLTMSQNGPVKLPFKCIYDRFLSGFNFVADNLFLKQSIEMFYVISKPYISGFFFCFYKIMIMFSFKQWLSGRKYTWITFNIAGKDGRAVCDKAMEAGQSELAKTLFYSLVLFLNKNITVLTEHFYWGWDSQWSEGSRSNRGISFLGPTLQPNHRNSLLVPIFFDIFTALSTKNESSRKISCAFLLQTLMSFFLMYQNDTYHWLIPVIPKWEVTSREVP